jgi:sodium transport system permease protein
MKASLRKIWIVFKKGVVDNLRDRRSISSSLLTPVFMPLFMIALIIVVGQTVIRDITEKPLDLPVAGAEYAPGLIAYLQENKVNIQPAPADPVAAVREGEANVVLVISPDYDKAFQEGRPAPLSLVLDSTRQSASPSIQRARSLISGYGNLISVLRLHARGIDPQSLSVLTVEMTDISTPQSNAVVFLNMLPFLLVMTVFIGGMYVIIDTTAGERERGSLEPLLINPVPRRDFVLGKLFASLPFGVATLGLALLLFGLGFNLVPLENYTGMQMNINVLILLNIFWVSLPIVLLASAMQIVVASFTRSFKEAQTYLPFLPLIAGLPGAFLAFVPVKTTIWVAIIPIFSQSVLITQLLRGETILPLNLLVSLIATLVAAVIFTLLAIWLYQREGILFGNK